MKKSMFEKLDWFLIILLIGVLPFGSFTVLSVLNLNSEDDWFMVAVSGIMFVFFLFLAYDEAKDIISNQ